MLAYLGKRIIETIPIIFVVSVLIFFFTHLIPGDPARLVAGPDASLDEVMQIRERLG